MYDDLLYPTYVYFSSCSPTSLYEPLSSAKRERGSLGLWTCVVVSLFARYWSTSSPRPNSDDASEKIMLADVVETLENPMATLSEDKPAKEQRLYRVGLSYACKRCGLPKKGHVCAMKEGDAPSKPAGKKRQAKGSSKSGLDAVQSGDALQDNKRPRTADDSLPSQTQSAVESSSSSGGNLGADDRGSDAKGAPTVSEDAALLGKLLEDVRETQRPPSLITPGDGDAPRCAMPQGMMSAISALPTSLTSPWCNTPQLSLSPGQFMLCTPAPTGSPSLQFPGGLSPATLNAVGAPLSSPGLGMLAEVAEVSARKRPLEGLEAIGVDIDSASPERCA